MSQPADVPALSLVLPAYNEAGNVAATLTHCLAALPDIVASFEIIVVNDASTDETGTIARAIAAQDPRVRVFDNPINLNAGQSLRVGLAQARGEVVLHNGMDLPFQFADLGRALAALEGHDAVVVYRRDLVAHSRWRRVTSLVNKWLIRILFLCPIEDMNFVQLWRRAAVRRLPLKARSPSFVTPELVLRGLAAGLAITHITAPFHERRVGAANFGKPRDILWSLADMLAFRIERWMAGGRDA